MKSLIKLIMLGAVLILVLYLGFSVYGKPLLEKAASRILQTDIRIDSLELHPTTLHFRQLRIQELDIVFEKGIINLTPPRLCLFGLRTKKLQIKENNIQLELDAKKIFSRQRNMGILLVFKNISLSALSREWPDIWAWGFVSGNLNGKIEGSYSKKKCKFSGIIHFDNMIYKNNTQEEDKAGPLGLSIQEIAEFVKGNNGSIDIDFTYKGPPNELNNLFNYRPGPKIIRLISTSLLNNLLDK